MNIFSKSTAIIFLGVIFVLAVFLSKAEAQNESLILENESVSEVEANAKQVRDEGQTGQTAQRGIFQPSENRLVLQLDDLKEEQRVRIDELNQEHREKVLELRTKLRNRVITREAFLEERRTHFDIHQQELKNVLTKAQWEQLQKLRAERRRTPSE